MRVWSLFERRNPGAARGKAQDRFVEIMETGISIGNPLLTAVQLVPLSVERNTPSKVPAKRFVSLTASAKTKPPHGPFVRTHCPRALTDISMTTRQISITCESSSRFTSSIIRECEESVPEGCLGSVSLVKLTSYLSWVCTSGLGVKLSGILSDDKRIALWIHPPPR